MTATRWVWIALPTGGRALAFTYVDPSAGASAKGGGVPDPPTDDAVRRAIDHPDQTFRQPFTGQPIGAAEALRMGLPKDPPWIGHFERKPIPPPRGEASRTVTAIVHREGATIAGARVRIGQLFGQAKELIELDERVTDATGNCEFPLAPVTEIAAIANLGVHSSKLVMISDSGVVELELGAPGALVGQVTKRGAPIAGYVSMTGRSGGVHQSMYTDANGRYRLAGIVPDAYAVTVEGVDPRNHMTCGTPTHAEVTIEAGQDTRGDYELFGGTQIDVKIVVDTKEIMADVYLFAGSVAPATKADVTAEWRSRDPRTFHSANSLRNDGKHITTRFADIAPGHYTLCVAPSARRTSNQAQPVLSTPVEVGTEALVITAVLPPVLAG
jgi:hypothetical protein